MIRRLDKRLKKIRFYHKIEKKNTLETSAKTQKQVPYLFSNKTLIALFIPLIIEQFLSVFVGLADSIMIAYVGEEAVSAVSLVDSVMLLLLNVFAAFATGGAIIIGQYLGQKREEQAGKAANELVWFSAVFSVAIMVLVYTMRFFLLDTVFGEITAEVRSLSNLYLLTVTASVPFIALFNAGAAIFRSAGNSKLPMLVALFMNIVNVVGNAVLIYGFKIGILGAAVPTLVSRILGAVVILILAARSGQYLRILPTIRHKFDKSMVRRILNVGVPYGLESGLFQLGKIVVLSLIASFGTEAIAANAVSTSLAVFQILPGMAINLGMTTVISRCVGFGDYEQAKYYHKKILTMVFIAQFVMCTLIYALLPPVLTIYGLSALTTSYIKDIMLLHTVCAIFIWPLSFTLPVTLRSSGDATYPMIVGVASMFLCRVAMAYVLSIFFQVGVIGAWYGMILDWIARTVFFIYRYYSKKWMQFKVV